MTTAEFTLAARIAQIGDGTCPIKCPCGWDADGGLTLVDRYITDWPPGPRGPHPMCFVEVYRDHYTDPDDLTMECPECGNDLAWEAVPR